MSFKYNSDGIRTSKTVVDTSASEDYTVEYVLDGSKILRETHIDNTTNAVIRTLDFFYDDTGVAGFTLNGTPYYYIKNLQGDVIHICSASGGIVATYVYDAWGYVVSTTAGVGQINPFRYRGYYYDSESELYYLNSRYYDSQVGRFINADGIIGANGGLQGYNMFAYCNNNPVMYSDYNGMYISRPYYTDGNGPINPNFIRNSALTEDEEYVLSASKEFNVDPAMIAAVIAVEQIYNYDIFDMADTPLAIIGVDTSIGIGQVKVSTAILMEELGYIEKSSNYLNRIARLNDVETNIRYVSAYLAYMRDVWIIYVPDFEQRPDIWWTTYNKGATNAHANPGSNELGFAASLLYDYYSSKFATQIER